MNETLFGSFATIEKRVAYARAQCNGIQHQHKLTPQVPQAGDSPTLTILVGLEVTIKQLICRVLEPDTAVLPCHLVRTEWDLLNWRYYQIWRVTLPPQLEGTIVRYQIEGDPDLKDTSCAIFAEGGTTFSYLVGDPTPPAWAADAIIYQLFPDRFYPGNGRAWNPVTRLTDIYGGTLRGIIDKLDYIADLGFNCLWLNPFFPDKSHHGYHATDYFTVNPRLGTQEEIIELVDKAHAKGIRLLLDFVANHWGSEHETFQTALVDPKSDYYHWYNWIAWPHDYHTFFGVKELPQINVDYPAVRDYLFRSIRYWLGDIGFDGLRLDYALGPSHDFWTALRAVAKKANPDAWLFGEALETPAALRGYEGRFDGCLDFLLTQALRNTFAFNQMTFTAFDAFLNQHEAFFPAYFSRPSFLDNHDMDRFFFIGQEDVHRLKMAALCQFTLSGPPIVYNGTEVGVSQEVSMRDSRSQGMEESRQPMIWGDGQNKDLLAYYRWLIAFRHQHPVLRYGTRETVLAHDDIYVYKRFDDTETIFVAFNRTEQVQEVVTAVHTFTLAPYTGDVYILSQ